MERKLASIQRITKLEPIENADVIELASVLGWKCIVKKGEFKEGDFCCFFEIDSLIPFTEWSSFLFKNSRTGNYRLKTIRLRGCVSQGLVLPLHIFTNLANFTAAGDGSYEDWYLGDKHLNGLHSEGLDLSEELGITKYEPYIPANLQGICKSTFPSWIPKTDEERIQSAPWILEQYPETEVYITEKLDGCSMTIYLKDGEFGVCSRNMDLLESAENTYWQVARRDGLEEKLRGLNKNIAIQGELIGQGIQKNKYQLLDKYFYIYNVYDIDNHQYYTFQDACDLVHQIGMFFVPGIAPSVKLKELGTVEDLIKYTNQLSIINNTILQEGIVVRSVDNIEILKFGRFSFKVINPNWLLKYGE